MYKSVNLFKITLSISLWTGFLCTYLMSCKVAPMYLRNNQVKNADKKDGIVRVYMDKRGALYPSVNVVMDSSLFKHRRLLHSVLKDPDASSLSWYFTSDPQRLAALRQAYHVSAGNSPIRDFQAVQDRILADYVNLVEQQVRQQRSSVIVFFIHGFNEPYPEKDGNYPTVKSALLQNGNAVKQQPVFVELYWDGLNAYGHRTGNEARIWPYANYNSRWVGLSLRNLFLKLEHRVHLPLVVVTHSLGAGVATVALFNNMTTGDNFKIDAASLQKLQDLMKIPTPTVEIRLGMLAPAIPGQPVFADFNKRSPFDITAGQNNIQRMVIGYDPFDFATSKDFLRIFELARFDGSTTLGCDYYWKNIRTTDIELVTDTLKGLGYNTDRLLYPVRFYTGVRCGTGGNHQHFMQYYIGDSPHAKTFFEDLFK